MGRLTYADLKEHWERTRAFEERNYRKQEKVRRASAREVIAALDAYYAVTGEAAFRDAAQLIGQHGLDKQDAGTFKRAITKRFGDPVKIAVVWMDERIRRQHLSLRRAAALAAVQFAVPGNSFEGVVERLETAYRQLVKSSECRPAKTSKKRAHVFSK